MDYLISIHSEYAKMIFDGSKTVELRNRKLQLELPSRLWIYVTTPTKMLEGFAEVSSVDYGSPKNIWEMHNGSMGLTESQFYAYAGKRTVLSAISVSNAVRFAQPVALSRLREISPLFHPPQFYMDLSSKPALTKKIKQEIAESVA